MIKAGKSQDFPLNGHFSSATIGPLVYICGGNQGTKILCSTFVLSLQSLSYSKKANMMTERVLHCLLPDDQG